VSIAEFNIEEAQLFRKLVALFGKDCVIPNMSLSTVISDSYEGSDGSTLPFLTERQAGSKCLFTIVDANDKPGLVVEFAATEGDIVDIERLERCKHLEPILSAHNIRFVTLSLSEFNETLDPSSGVKFISLLQGKLDDADADADWNCAKSKE